MSAKIDPEVIVDRYFKMFEVPHQERERVVVSLFAEAAYYCDPLTEAQSHSERLEVAADFQNRFPGCDVKRSSEIDQHHNQIRFNWVMTSADGDEIADGIDVLLLDDRGDVTHALGFFGQSPPPLVPAHE